MSLRHLALLTRDLRGTERFYTDVLGLEEAFAHEGMIFLRTPGREDLLNFVETPRPFDPRAAGLDEVRPVPPAARAQSDHAPARGGPRAPGDVPPATLRATATARGPA